MSFKLTLTGFDELHRALKQIAKDERKLTRQTKDELVRRSALSVWQNQTDTVIAASAEDAQAVWKEHNGKPDDPTLITPESWGRLPNDHVLMVDSVGRTCAEWCLLEGRSFFGSSEF